jgi:hypothetical protein
VIRLHIDLRLLEGRAEVRAAAKSSRVMPTSRLPNEWHDRKVASPLDYITPFGPMIWTDEVHVPNGVSIDDIAWDEIHESIEVPSRPAENAHESQHLGYVEQLARFNQWVQS